MIFGKTDPKQCAATAGKGGLHPQAHALLSEVLRLLWLSASLYLLLALASYSPSDPSWSTWTSKTTFHNWMGRAGSILADVLLQVFGLTSFAVAGLLAVTAVKRPSEKETVRMPWHTYSPAFFLVSLSLLIQCLSPRAWRPMQLSHPGGVMGQLLGSGLVYLTGKTGSLLLSSLFFLISVILLFRWQLVTWSTALCQSAYEQTTVFFTELMTSSRALVEAGLQRLHRPATVPAAPPISAGVVPGALKPAPAKAAVKPAAKPKKDDDKAEDSDATGLISTTPSDDAEELFRMIGPKPKPVKEKAEARPAKASSLIAFQLPPLSLLSGKAESKTKPIDKTWYLEKASILVQKLKDFGVEGEVVHISPGPVITVYEFKPASGVKIKEIANLSDDLTLALSVLSVRIVAPIPGKPVVGIEIPSPHRETVFFKDLVEETSFYNGDIRIPIVLGRLASGEPVVAGLASMPHLLVAGSTGTGKSVFINTLISSLLYRYTPQQLKLILVDPKMVELSTYEGIPHLLLPVVVDSKKASLALRWTVDEMERRYTLMHQTGVRHVDAYNEKLNELQSSGEVAEVHTFLPYIVVVIDEYADLMAVVPKDVELSIARLAQKARASGIHLVLATQRPSTDVVTGTIKANFPSRISFRVASSIDSKTILDRTGADRLLGSGDMLFHSAGFTSLKRLQGAYLSDTDLEKVVEFLKAQGEPEYDERLLRAQEQPEEGDAGDSAGGSGDEAGRLYDAAVRLVTEKGEASISLIQRHLKIGYNRAASLMEELEKEGVVAQATGASKRRQVLVNQI